MTRPKVQVEELFTPAEVARILQCHPKTVVRYVSAGRLSVRRTLGQHRRITGESLRAALIDGGMTAVEVAERIATVRR